MSFPKCLIKGSEARMHFRHLYEYCHYRAPRAAAYLYRRGQIECLPEEYDDACHDIMTKLLTLPSDKQAKICNAKQWITTQLMSRLVADDLARRRDEERRQQPLMLRSDGGALIERIELTVTIDEAFELLCARVRNRKRTHETTNDRLSEWVERVVTHLRLNGFEWNAVELATCHGKTRARMYQVWGQILKMLHEVDGLRHTVGQKTRAELAAERNQRYRTALRRIA